MEESEDKFELTPERQDTARLLERLLGSAIADRYVDFCRLAAGTLSLLVASPLAAHALRELELILRQTLEVPLDAKATISGDDRARIAAARKYLREAGFDADAIGRSARALEPRTHRDQIRGIVSRLGLAPEGDIARAWLSISNAHGKAHQRPFLRSLAVDDEFRAKWQRPFDMVVRGLAIALQGRYSALMRRVEELAAMKDVSEAVKLFENEIPGALPLQWHFYENLKGEEWLPHLVQSNLIGEPLLRAYQGTTGPLLREWPAGRYLLRMAKSSIPQRDELVAQAIRNVAGSKHPDVYRDAFQIVATLPPDEAVTLADVAIGWLQPGSLFFGMQAPQDLVQCLAEGGQKDAALRVARALLQLFEQGGDICSLYARHMYEHHLPRITEILTGACNVAALKLFCDLLQDAAVLSGKAGGEAGSDVSHYSSRPIADDSMAQQDIYDALIAAVRRSADMILRSDPQRMAEIIALFESYPQKIFVRIALHVLAKGPGAAPELAEGYLRNPDLVANHRCREEYAELALAWFPSLDAQKQQVLLDLADAVPARYKATWEQGFKERHNRTPDAEDERRYQVLTIREVLWRWRAALPPARQQVLDDTVAEFGDPDAWKVPFWGQSEASPLTSADISAQPVEVTLAFISSWQPGEEPRRQTLTALAYELRNAADQDPTKYAEAADRFASLRPVFIRNLFEGLAGACKNKRRFPWGAVLRLIEGVYSRIHAPVDAAAIAEGDDPNWLWTCAAASDLLKSGLLQGKEAIALEHAAVIEGLVFRLHRDAPKAPERENFEERYSQYPYFAATSALRGAAVELCIVMMFWLSKHPESSIAREPRHALQNLSASRHALEAELADISSTGRIPRAVIGWYLNWLVYFGEDWVKRNVSGIFPESDDALRHAAWSAHLQHNQGPIAALVPELRPLYIEEIGRLADPQSSRDIESRRNNLSDHLLILYLWGELPDDLLEAFWQAAPSVVRKHAMWFLGKHLALPPGEFPDEFRARARSYWESRLKAAKTTSNPDAFREELGMIGQWCNRDHIGADWLLDQLLDMLQAGFAPGSGFSVMSWLAKLSETHVDRVVAVLAAYFACPWASIQDSMFQKDAIRTVLETGHSKGTPETVARVEEIVSRLATFGESGYMYLLRVPAE